MITLDTQRTFLRSRSGGAEIRAVRSVAPEEQLRPVDKLPLGRSAPGVRVNRLADLNHLGVSAICKWERSIPVVANEVPWSTGYGGTISVRRGTDNRRMHKFLSNPNF